MTTHQSHSHYLILCPLGLESVMEHAIASALRDFYGEDQDDSRRSTKISRIFPTHSTIKLQEMQAKVASRREKSRTKRSATCPSDRSTHIVVGPSNDGSETFVGEYRGKVVMAWPGATEMGLLLVTTAAPAETMTKIRLVGPILALVCFRQDMFDATMQADDVVDAIAGMENDEDVIQGYRRALCLWSRHARLWEEQFRCPDVKVDALESKVLGEAGLTFRASCIRNRKGKNKQFKGPDLYSAIGSSVPANRMAGRPLIDVEDDIEDNKIRDISWKVNLSSYDFEVVGFVMDTHFVLAVSLLPHRKMNSVDFSKGTMPSDITLPFLTQKSDVIRLRPSTASLLLHLAKPDVGDVLVDVCAGIGTLPVEAHLTNGGVLGIGGDLALDVTGPLHGLAAQYLTAVRSWRETSSCRGASDLHRWDATMLPLRDATADIIVSDLPFGQRCMSAYKLAQFVPLLVVEIARILKPGGRAVLLGGSYQTTLNALHSVGEHVFHPCDSIFPVNIGGLLAYIIEVRRSDGTPFLSNYKERVHRMTARRELLRKHETAAQKRQVQVTTMGKTEKKGIEKSKSKGSRNSNGTKSEKEKKARMVASILT
mmetsp:Transcript_3795/g.7069  ORF Transcript_3795/g.7069 Transcript_3795/m.7069 type:complete len:596 (-) Transcript_3795:50-1837(-)|eukprot:CAMPEP_0113307860 /NCGR_PEP_ID=MMETSP0010_2-20120614/6535_1 /TAXON_ID=216773 ORGANISM="Corethron hystrix, Strain 308" /NCGR_SAMPLE_ID=MMETSP0010_2 /ASSEMBLY_ACC=CAM_ASM_000155 /LENGTH=595 /DNA_ID=CAMNT_0000162797 /DNA_START=181 /DNA_END=1968 /DNA_ORIENTATION=- /assembly_acc=CAM_ASM_000155